MENTLKIKINNEDETIKLGEILAKNAKKGMFIALNGDLGAGKTTLTKGIGKALGVDTTINSPTFTIMKIHNAKNQIDGIDKLYHLDVYRLTDSSGDFELEEYFYQDGLTVVEWCDIIKDLIPDEYVELNFKIIDLVTRVVTIKTTNGLTEYLNKIKKELEDEKYEIIYWYI